MNKKKILHEVLKGILLGFGIFNVIFAIAGTAVAIEERSVFDLVLVLMILVIAAAFFLGYTRLKRRFALLENNEARKEAKYQQRLEIQKDLEAKRRAELQRKFQDADLTGNEDDGVAVLIPQEDQDENRLELKK